MVKLCRGGRGSVVLSATQYRQADSNESNQMEEICLEVGGDTLKRR